MGFIRQPDPSAVKDARIAELEEQLASEKHKSRRAEASAIKAMNAVAEIEEECPECMDLCALEQTIEDINCEILTAKRIAVNELGDNCAKTPAKFICNGLTPELCVIRELMAAYICELEYDLAIAYHNLAYCHAKNAPAYIECKKNDLMDMIECNPDMDSRCRKFAEQILLQVCA